ncbi:MAG: tRNA 4-thiouridine(8) synthase ThiI [Firmicutes bacterium]|nr:tRNA 4-thiouridine(8) synthase ThiI [Bacillota bacterium]
MEKSILIRIGEIYLKGRNRFVFDNLLASNIKRALKEFGGKLTLMRNRYVAYGYPLELEGRVAGALVKIPGIHSFSPVFSCETDFDNIIGICLTEFYTAGSFRVTVNRADKRFGNSSRDICIKVADALLEKNPGLTVDLHNPEHVLNIDIRENGTTFIFFESIPGLCGMPVGSAGEGLALISGGIDSPAAAFQMLRRGLKIQALHFDSQPYTSPLARDKVKRLISVVAGYNGPTRSHFISATEIQRAIDKHCDASCAVILLRRFMMEAASVVAIREKCGALVTGEALGQVASQTVESMACTGAAATLPVLRPLIALDKDDIIAIAQKIGTYDISVLPHEDCCTVFLPKNPQTKPRLGMILEQENRIPNRQELIKTAIEAMETETIKP